MDIRGLRLKVSHALFLMIFLTSIPATYSLFGRAGLEAISVIATTLLTLALVVLYDQQHLALRYQQEPHLEISSMEIAGNLQHFDLEISNFGGGPATAMDLKIELYELSGEGPMTSVSGGLRRVEPDRESVREKTRASSIRPSEINIPFSAESKGVLSSGENLHDQDSLASILARHLADDRNVIYGKVSIMYTTNFAEGMEHVADFSIKFTRREELEYELMDFLPWEDQHEIPALGG